MKKIFMTGLLLLAAAPSWAKIGTHNLLLSFNVGAGIYHDKTFANNSSFEYSFSGIGGTSAKALLGFDIGYLLHKVTASGTIHGMDLRLGILGDIPTTGYSGESHGYYSTTSTSFAFRNPMLLTLSIGYAPGRQFKTFRLSFDVVHFGLSFAFAKMRNLDTGASRIGIFMGSVIQLPLGMHFLLNSGTYFALRHSIVVNPYSGSTREPIVKYALMFSLGYAFGK